MSNKKIYSNRHILIVEEEPGSLGIWLRSGVLHTNGVGEVCMTGANEITAVAQALLAYAESVRETK